MLKKRRDAAGAVDDGRLVEVAGDALQPGGDEDEREPEAGPDARRPTPPSSAVPGVVEQARLLDDREQVAQPADVRRARRRAARAGRTTSGWRRRPTWRRSTRRSPGRSRCRGGTCRPAPPGRRRAASPTGTVIARELERHDQGVAELVAAEHVDVLVPAVGPAVVALGVAALMAEPHGPPERVEHEHRSTSDRRREQQHGRGQITPPRARRARVGRPTGRGRVGRSSTPTPGTRPTVVVSAVTMAEATRRHPARNALPAPPTAQ